MTASGFYHCSVKPVGRADGRSVVAAAAYRSGERLADERTGEVFDYRARGGVVDTFIVTRDGVAAQERAQLWNGAERIEPRANGRLATELELALPHELTDAQRKRLVMDFLAPIIARHGVAADVAIHAPGEGRDHRNTHAHVLITHRELGPEGFGEIANRRTITKKVKGQEKQIEIAGIAATSADIKAIRKDWEQHVNRAYERAGLDIRVDHRSHEDRGIEDKPSKHLGPTAAAIERKGIASERGDLNRDIAQRNVDRRALKALDIEARQIAAALIELETERAAADQRQAESSRYDGVRATQQENIEAERRAASETARVFASAAARTTEPRVENFDRDAANADWADKVAAAGIASDRAATAPEEARQQPGDTATRETRAAFDAPSASPVNQPEAAIEERASRTASRMLAGIGRMAEIILGGLASFFVAEPKLTADQAMRAGRVADERAEANAVAAAAHQVEAIYDQQAEQQRGRDIARAQGIETTGDPEEDRFRSIMQRAARDRDRDRDYERER
jgi:hypothetical protein